MSARTGDPRSIVHRFSVYESKMATEDTREVDPFYIKSHNIMILFVYQQLSQQNKNTSLTQITLRKSESLFVFDEIINKRYRA